METKIKRKGKGVGYEWEGISTLLRLSEDITLNRNVNDK